MSRDAGVDILRAFVDKSRTSPYDYRGLEIQRGLDIVKSMKAATGLPGRLRAHRPAPPRGVPRSGHRYHPDRARASAQYSRPCSRSFPASARRSCSSTASATDLNRVALRRRLHHVRTRPGREPHRRRQPERHPLLPRHPLVRVRDAFRRRHLHDPAGAQEVAPAPHRRPLPQLRRPLPRRARLLRLRGGRAPTASSSTSTATPRRPSAMAARPCARRRAAS